MEGSNDEVLVDVEKLATELEKQTSSSASKKFYIQRATKLTRDLDETAFIPRFVSIGPYHHGRKELQSMEQRKRRICNYPTDTTLNSSEELDRLLIHSSTATMLHQHCFKFESPSATELLHAGVKFELHKNNQSIMDICFKDEVLRIPKLTIVSTTEVFFRNMVASEQRPHISDNYYNDYIAFMSTLVRSRNDIEILVENGIIRSIYDSERTLSIIGTLAETYLIWRKRYYYTTFVQQLHAYCSDRRHKWKAILKRDYFSNPWTIISVIAASILLIFTMIQTACSIMQL